MVHKNSRAGSLLIGMIKFSVYLLLGIAQTACAFVTIEYGSLLQKRLRMMTASEPSAKIMLKRGKERAGSAFAAISRAQLTLLGCQ